MNILVRRSSALGDVLCVTPVLARLRRDHPDANIVVHTIYHQVFEDNPHCNAVNSFHGWDRQIDLDMAHETRRAMHAIDAYMEIAFGDHGDDDTDKSIVFKNLPELKIDNHIAIHTNKSWRNRTMPNKWWDEVVIGLNKAGYQVVLLGTSIDYLPMGQVIDTRQQLTLKQQASVIAHAKAFVCGPSGLMILAGATETPVVVPLTINTPDTCLPWRHGVLGWGFHPIIADVPCMGCNAEQGPVTFVECNSSKKDLSKPDYACIDTIKSEAALELALMVANENR